MKYRKKPIVIEAIQLKDGNLDKILEFCKENITTIIQKTGGDISIEIETLEGRMLAHQGDYIIKGIKGEFYPCKEEIFLKTYEPESEGKNDDGILRL